MTLDDLAAQVRMLRQVNAKVAKFGRLQTELQNRIKDRLGDAEVGTVGGLPAVTWKGTWRDQLSQKLLKELHPEIAAEVSAPAWVRTFKVLDG